MKTYVITLSQVFPTCHKRAGEPTKFRAAFQSGQTCSKCKKRNPAMCTGECFSGLKIHTIRANYPLWLKRITEVQQSKAVLSVRQWTGKPYRSPQEEIAILTNEDGLGIQELKMIDLFSPTTINGNRVELPDLAANDGLSFNDWYEWFKGYDLKQPLAIIHFTKFRY
ncbi:hypothetical protein AAH098_15350 [Bacteroides uniformis]|jgi:hypothetical protein|uniref:hypothetical protein n=1 Tax=Bacteroides uniformis TaxID=820 RepID=UPI0039B58E21